eukprot:symbB.v1.2.020391.t1/scaffold1715.1/size104970/1
MTAPRSVVIDVGSGCTKMGFSGNVVGRPQSALNMASYSVALQLRAAQEVIKREMPLRSLATRVLLMCDVASALLLI